MRPATMPGFRPRLREAEPQTTWELAVARTFRCSIVTPAESTLSVDADYVSFEAFDGQRGVLAGASPFVVALGSGPVRVQGQGTTRSFVVDGGFAQMQGSVLKILADSAVESTAIEPSDAARELERAKTAAIEPGRTAPAERERLERNRRIASAKVAVSRR